MQSNDSNKSSNRQAREGFFIVNLEVWEKLFHTIDEQYSDTELIRVMAAYLTLCCGSGGDHVTTSWSSGSVYKYSGISPKTANRAIAILEEYKFIAIKNKAIKNKLPVYKINFFGNDIKSDKAKNIYIPNGVVTGVSSEASPLRRLVNEQNPHLLYLFIRLYYFQDKYLDVIDPDLVSSAINTENDLEAEMIFSFDNLLNIWCNEAENLTLSGYVKTAFYDFKKWESNSGDPFINERRQQADFYGFFGLLTDLGLLTQVVYAFNGDEINRCSDAEDSLSNQLDFIASVNSKQQSLIDAEMLKLKKTETDFTDAVYGCRIYLPAKYKKVHFQSFYQLRYRTKFGESKVRYAQEQSLYKEMLTLIKSVKGERVS